MMVATSPCKGLGHRDQAVVRAADGAVAARGQVAWGAQPHPLHLGGAQAAAEAGAQPLLCGVIQSGMQERYC